MLKWLVDSGGEVNVDIGFIGGYRGTVATEDMDTGATLAIIPLNNTFLLPTDVPPDSDGYEVHRAGVLVLEDMANPSSPFEPYWRSLPPRDTIHLSTYTIPATYVHLLQSKDVEDYVKGTQQMVKAFHTKMKERMDKSSISRKDLAYSLMMITTRYFGYENRSHLIPLLDMANHFNNCPNTHTTKECPKNPKAQCIFWEAGQPIKKGEEVCNSYGGMWNDRSFLQYGYLTEDPHLLGIDRHDYNDGRVWDNNMWDKEPPQFTSEKIEGYRDEARRLRWILADLLEGDAPAAEQEPAKTDPEGKMLDLVRQLRDLRKDALSMEIERLKNEVAAMGGEVQEEDDYWDVEGGLSGEGTTGDDGAGSKW